LPTFPFSNDKISVWKRTNYTTYGECNDDSESEEDVVGRDNEWKAIPLDERLPDSAAPCMAKFLRPVE
jgi:hypothetical protein